MWYTQKPMLCAGFSGDGSLLAVGAGDLITFWNPETNSLVSVVGESLHLTVIFIAYLVIFDSWI